MKALKNMLDKYDIQPGKNSRESLEKLGEKIDNLLLEIDEKNAIIESRDKEIASIKEFVKNE